jgi:hypothetical protein
VQAAPRCEAAWLEAADVGHPGMYEMRNGKSSESISAERRQPETRKKP